MYTLIKNIYIHVFVPSYFVVIVSVEKLAGEGGGRVGRRGEACGEDR